MGFTMAGTKPGTRYTATGSYEPKPYKPDGNLDAYSPRWDRGGRPAMQAETDDGWFMCSEHRVKYKVEDNPSGCPVCDHESQIASLRRDVEKVTRANSKLKREREELKAALDLSSTMRDAVEFLDDADRMFLKSAFVQWRADPDRISLTTHSKRSSKTIPKVGSVERDEIVGFRLATREGDQEARVMTSIGGRSLAMLLRDARQLMGHERATATFMQALVQGLG